MPRGKEGKALMGCVARLNWNIAAQHESLGGCSTFACAHAMLGQAVAVANRAGCTD